MSDRRDPLWDSGHLRIEREEARRLMELDHSRVEDGADGPVISLQDLALYFGDHVVLDGISLDVTSGETVCILGGSGAGKSTILRLILGLIRPDGGRIIVRGEDVATASRDELLQLRRDMGMVFQQAALFDSLTIESNGQEFLDHRQFHHGDDLIIAHLLAQTLEGFADGGGMVGEVVINGDTPGRSDHLQSTLYTLESGQAGNRIPRGNTHVVCRSDGRLGAAAGDHSPR